MLGPAPESSPLPGHSGLFLRNQGGTWHTLAGEGLGHAAEEVQGLPPVTAGRIRSAAIEGLVFDLDAFWELVDEIELP